MRLPPILGIQDEYLRNVNFIKQLIKLFVKNLHKNIFTDLKQTEQVYSYYCVEMECEDSILHSYSGHLNGSSQAF